MHVEVTTDTLIDRPRAEVAAYAADPDNATEWYVNIRSVAWATERPMQIGSRFDFVARFLGRRLAYTYEVVDWVPGVRLVMRTTSGPFPMETTYEWADEGGATRMRLTNRGRPSGFGRVLAPAMMRAMRKANQKYLARLKTILEAGSA